MPSATDPVMAPLPVATLATPTGQPVPPMMGNRGFNIGHQKVGLEVDFARKQLKGFTEVTINPTDSTLKQIRLNSRQCKIIKATVNGKPVYHIKHNEPYNKFKIHNTSTVYQHQMLRRKLDGVLHDPPDHELVITLPKMKIEPADPFSIATQHALSNRSTGRATPDAGAGVSTPGPMLTARPDNMYTPYAPLMLRIEYEIKNIRDGFTFVGCESGDMRYPHAYTTNSPLPGAACCLFPTLDGIHERWTWDIEITVPRTIGDIFKTPESEKLKGKMNNGINGTHDDPEDTPMTSRAEDDGGEGDDDLDFMVVCSADPLDEPVCVPNLLDPWKKVFKFFQNQPIAPQHISFAVGPFENVSLSEYRDQENEEAMGIMTVDVLGYCLPGREADLKNTCMFLPKAIDFMVKEFGQYIFSSFKLCFVDDLTTDTVETASLAICSNKLLFPETIIDTIWPVTKSLTYSLAAQWAGIQVVPKDWADIWVIVGMAYWMTGCFLKNLMGNNEYRFRLKKDAEKICELDIDRPSLYAQGFQVPIEPDQLDFIKLKAPVVLTILEKRLWKLSSSMVLHRVVRKTFLSAVAGELKNGLMSTAHFIRLCEKNSHNKLEPFFQQWVYGSGYPRFEISQRFNKKRMIVEMGIRQVQSQQTPQRRMTPTDFWKAASENQRHIVIGPVQPVFTGPMTIRIHEADGTPYEHVVDLKEGYTKLDIPYNTKYKRLKRSRRQKERAAAGAGVDVSVEVHQNDDVLLYCLGDVLQSEEEVDDWQMSDWTKEDEEKMSQESFEWIRMDADFEWICTLNIGQPDYMFLSQLQQDRDVIAQYDSIRHFASVRESALISSILVRTLMDRRYYYGIRVEAAMALARCATADLDWLGQTHLMKAFQEFFCFPNSSIPRGNDFSDFTAYYIQSAIPRALAGVRNISGDCPPSVKRWLIDCLRYNDNTNNAFDDSYYIANLMSSLAKTLTPSNKGNEFNYYEEQFEDQEGQDAQSLAIKEIERYKRMDAWKPSYRNIVSETALDILRGLTLRNVIDLDFKTFMPYTREGTLDTVRAKAFDCMIDLGALHEKPPLVRYICYTMGKDPSPYIRRHVQAAFGRGLGMIAMGEKKSVQNAHRMDPSSLTIEEVNVDPANTRKEELSKGTSVGAMAVLRKELQNHEIMKESLWDAVRSDKLGLIELRCILDMCAVLYEPKLSHIVVLKQQKHLSVEHVGKAMLKFKWAWGKPQKPKPAPVPAPSSAPSSVPSSAPSSAPASVKAPTPQPLPVAKPQTPVPPHRPSIKLITNPRGTANRGSQGQNGVSKKPKDPKSAVRRTASMSGSPTPSSMAPPPTPTASTPNSQPRKIILKLPKQSTLNGKTP
ncbi:hypothetical protein EDC01DRAFT_743499 [Geopyxis carbonaria]|nr:hypothetical protein EDC01DRAFT_743499 [Geopyxis carbonaria]